MILLFHFQVEAIENVGFGQLAKIYLYWKDPWWAPGEGGIQLAWPSDINGFSRCKHLNSMPITLCTIHYHSFSLLRSPSAIST